MLLELFVILLDAINLPFDEVFEDIIAPQSPVKKKKRGRPRKKPIDDNKKHQKIKTETSDDEDWKPKTEPNQGNSTFLV